MTKEKRIPIANSKIKNWKTQTLTELQMGTGLSYTTVMNAVTHGLATQSTVDKIDKYTKCKEALKSK
jgi:uncharacterized protein YdaT